MNPSIAFVVIFSFVLTQKYVACSNTTKTLGVSPETRILGGINARIGQFPYQVMVITEKESKSVLCGGAVITPRYVLTAAKCVYGVSNAVVYAGFVQRSNKGWSTGVKMIYIPIIYKSDNKTSDIALLQLESDLQIDGNRTNAVPIINYQVPTGTYCQITGWGAFMEGGKESDVLKFATVPVLDKRDCSLSTGYQNSPWEICAGYSLLGKDACKGDTGGPLVCNGYLTGIVSGAQGCARKNKPALYTDVYYHIDWLKSIMGSEYPKTMVTKISSTTPTTRITSTPTTRIPLISTTSSSDRANFTTFLGHVVLLLTAVSSLVYYH